MRTMLTSMKLGLVFVIVTLGAVTGCAAETEGGESVDALMKDSGKKPMGSSDVEKAPSVQPDDGVPMLTEDPFPRPIDAIGSSVGLPIELR